MILGTESEHFLDRFVVQARESDTGMIEWKNIHTQWKTYPEAVENIIERIFQAGGDEATLKGYCYTVRQICEVNQLFNEI